MMARRRRWRRIKIYKRQLLFEKTFAYGTERYDTPAPRSVRLYGFSLNIYYDYRFSSSKDLAIVWLKCDADVIDQLVER